MWARYEVSAEGLDQSRPPRNGTVSELVEELRESGPVLVTGEIDDDQAGLLDRIDGGVAAAGPPRNASTRSARRARLEALAGRDRR